MAESIKPVEVKYTQNPNTREYVLFPEEYFSGANCSIMFGHKHIVDISGFQFMLQEQHKPIYSYASRTFDDMAIGNRIVTGSFKVAFKDAGTLQAILKEVQDYQQDRSNPNELFVENEEIPPWVGDAGYSPESILGKAMMKNDKPSDSNIYKIYFGDSLIQFPPDAPPIFKDGVRMVPFRFIIEYFGYKTTYDDINGQYIFKHPTQSSIIIIKNSSVYINGQPITTPMRMFDNRIYVDIGMIDVIPEYSVTEENTKVTINRR